MFTNDSDIAVKRLTLDKASGTYKPTPSKALFIRGPIPMDWLSAAAHLPGKSLNVAMAIYWLGGMSKCKSFKLREDALRLLGVSRYAVYPGLTHLEKAGLIQVERKPGQRALVSILSLAGEEHAKPCK